MNTVLFVEDRADLRAVIKDALYEAGYDVHTVAAKPDGLADCESVAPDLVIYARDGVERGSVQSLDRMIGHLTRNGKNPVIVLSDDGENALNAGDCALCLPAPLDIDALIVAAAGLLSGELATPVRH